MKPIVVVLVVILAAVTSAGATAFGLAVLLGQPSDLEPAVALPEPATPRSEIEAEPIESLVAQLAMVGERLASLEREVGELRADAARVPALAPVEPTAASQLAAAELDFTSEQRELIAQIMDDVREQEQEERNEQRRQREEDSTLERAERIARELGLSAADQKALADHMTLALVKRNELMDRAREDGFDRETMRSDFMELRDWSDRSMIDTFGEDLAGQIREADRSARWGPGGGGFGRGDAERGTGAERGGGARGGGGSRGN